MPAQMHTLYVYFECNIQHCASSSKDAIIREECIRVAYQKLFLANGSATLHFQFLVETMPITFKVRSEFGRRIKDASASIAALSTRLITRTTSTSSIISKNSVPH